MRSVRKRNIFKDNTLIIKPNNINMELKHLSAEVRIYLCWYLLKMNFEHNYELKTKPNLGKRFVAGLIDYGLIMSYFLLLYYFFGEPNEEGGYSVNGSPGFSIIMVWFILTIGLEQITGSTLGNKSQGLKVAPKIDPRKSLTFEQSLKRHLLDMIDLWPFGLLGILTIKNTEHNQRLGDLWAKTVVLDKTDPFSRKHKRGTSGACVYTLPRPALVLVCDEDA
jgi:uncharacterized RDD family membrane protein YckC